MSSLLVDKEIRKLLRSTPSLIENFDVSKLSSGKSPIRGASLDLTVGEIFVPGAKSDEVGGLDKPRTQISLKSGQTAVLRSAEKLRMPPEVAGIGFPPSTRVSLAGLLSTNPGHVDPGYVGHVHLTVVNMGKDDFHISKGDRLMRLMLFGLNTAVEFPVGEPNSPLSEELMGRLSHDFLDIDGRARKAAKAEELALRTWQVWATIVTAIITAVIALGYQYLSSQRDLAAQISKIEGRLSSLGGSLSVVSFEDQLKKVNLIEGRLKALEETSQTRTPQ